MPASGAGLARPVAAQATTYLVMELLPGGDIFEQVIRRFGRANDETDRNSNSYIIIKLSIFILNFIKFII